MSEHGIDWDALRAPFRADEIEWRVSRAGKNDRGPWALVLAYMTSRAVQDRLDTVVGPENWRTEFRLLGNTLSAGLALRIGDEWVWKWDGAGHLAASDGLGPEDAGKGDYSNALKRVAVQWGVGRYLYRLPEGFAAIRPDGSEYGRLPKKDGGDVFHWDPPGLPKWALPGGSGKPEPGEDMERKKAPKGGGSTRTEKSEPSANGAPATDAPATDAPACPTCGKDMWDNREDKRNPRSPDFKCKDKDCATPIWIDGLAKDVQSLTEQAVLAGAISAEEAAQTVRVAVEPKHPTKLVKAKQALDEKLTHFQGAP